MPREVRRLTDREVRGAKDPGYHSDGDGLYLQITEAGSRSWIYRYSIGGRRREMGLGSLRDVSLAGARNAKDEAKQQIAAGKDPVTTRRPAAPTAQLEQSAPRIRGKAPEPTLLNCWNEYVAAHEPAWRGKKTKAGWVRSIESHASAIARKPIAKVDVDDVLLVLRPIWMTKAESAGKLRERLERVLDYAKVRRLRTGENPAAWKGNLVHLLPPRPKLQRGHMRAIPYQQVPSLMERLAHSEGMSARALEFTILTAAREGMTLEATWGEIAEDVWELAATRMKGRAFRQPLSSGALSILRRVRPEHARPDQFIFPGPRGGTMSNMAMDMLLRDLAPPYTPHGMRSAFRDWAGDETDFAREVVEECLAHSIGDETERAYRRGDAIKKRKAVLEAWSSYCLSIL